MEGRQARKIPAYISGILVVAPPIYLQAPSIRQGAKCRRSQMQEIQDAVAGDGQVTRRKQEGARVHTAEDRHTHIGAYLRDG